MAALAAATPGPNTLAVSRAAVPNLETPARRNGFFRREPAEERKRDPKEPNPDKTGIIKEVMASFLAGIGRFLASGASKAGSFLSSAFNTVKNFFGAGTKAATSIAAPISTAVQAGSPAVTSGMSQGMQNFMNANQAIFK